MIFEIKFSYFSSLDAGSNTPMDKMSPLQGVIANFKSQFGALVAVFDNGLPNAIMFQNHFPAAIHSCLITIWEPNETVSTAELMMKSDFST